MHPITARALVAERISQWHGAAARDRLANEALRARRGARLAAGLLRRQDGSTRMAGSAATAGEPAGAADERQPAVIRAA